MKNLTEEYMTDLLASLCSFFLFGKGKCPCLILQSSRKSVGPPDMSVKIVSGPVTIPRNPDRMSGVVFAPKI